MARYDQTKKSTINGKRYYGTTIYDKIPERNTDMYFIAQYGDRCDVLAQRFYGTASLWWIIAASNNLKTMNIQAGTSLRIPVASSVKTQIQGR